MPGDPLEGRAHELIALLEPHKLAAVVSLMERMLHDDEPVTEEDRRRLTEGEAIFNSGKGIPMEDVLADFGLTVADFPVQK